MELVWSLQIVKEALRRWKIVQGIFDEFRGSGFMDMGIQQQLVLTENWKKAINKFFPIINRPFSILPFAIILTIIINTFYPFAISFFLFRLIKLSRFKNF